MNYSRLLSIVLILSGFFTVSYSQTLQESIEARNKGAELMNSGNIDGAITELEKCVEISTKVGPEADENRNTAISVLPGLYLQKATKLVDDKNYAAALTALNAAVAAAEKYNNADVKEKAEKPIPTVYYAIGATAYQDKSYDDAVKNLDQAIKLDPDMARAYYLKGIIFQQQKNTSAMVENFQLAIDKGAAVSDNTTAKNASTALRTYYFNAGIQALQAKKYVDAIPNFEGAVKADPTYADAYWRLSSCYNSTSKFDDAIANINKGLEYKAGEDKDKAGLYYELGVAYAGKKDAGNACNSFKKALFEPYAAAAKYQIETALKCK